MKKLLLKIYGIVKYWQKRLLWNKESKQILDEINETYFAEIFPKDTSFLVILPHADDEWIGCGSLIGSRNYKVHICNADMEGGDSKSVHLLRRLEIKRLADMYDRQIFMLKEEKAKSLRKLIEVVKPDIVMVPYLFDWHPEHIEVMRILKMALETKSFEWDLMVGMYQVTIPISVSNITHISRFSKSDWEKKWRIFRNVYRTQSLFPWYRVSLNEVIQGKRFGAEACEVFCVLPYNKWLTCYGNAPTEKEQLALRTQLSSIKALYAHEQINLV